MKTPAATAPVAVIDAGAARKLWRILLGASAALLLVGITLLVIHAVAYNRVVYADQWAQDPVVGEGADSSWPGRHVEQRIPLFHDRSCPHRTIGDGPMPLGEALHAGYLPCDECLRPGFGRAAEMEWTVAGTITTVGGLGVFAAAVSVLLVAKRRFSRCPRCGSRRTLNFCSTCGGKLTTAPVQPMRQ